MGANWLRPVAVLAGVAFIALVTLAVPPLRQAIGHVTSNVLTGGQTSGGAGTDGNGTRNGGGGGTLTNGARNTAAANPVGPGSTAAPGWKATSQCQPARGQRDANWIQRADRGGRLVRPARYADAGVRLPGAHHDGEPAGHQPLPDGAELDGDADVDSDADVDGDTHLDGDAHRRRPARHRPTPARAAPRRRRRTPTAGMAARRWAAAAERLRERAPVTGGRTANLACMEWLAPVAGPPVFLVPPGSLDAEVITLSGPEGHHAAAVRRLRPGERADVSDGAGTIAECAVLSVDRDSVALSVRSVHTVPAPEPRITVVQALPKGDRGELAVELMTEVGVDAVIPWAAQRCVVRWQGDRGERALAKWRATAREAAKQSRRAWLPEVPALASLADVAKRASDAACAVVLEADAAAALSHLTLPDQGEIVLVVGPEGGITPAERAALGEAGAVEARLGPTVLRTSTAGAAAAAVLLTRTSRW